MANKLLSTDTGLQLKLGYKQGLKCLVQRDEDASDWLGWWDKPIT